MLFIFFFLFKQKTAYEVRISDWSSDVCSSDLQVRRGREGGKPSLPARSNEGITNKCSFYEFLYSKSLLLSEGNREGFPPSLGHLTCGYAFPPPPGERPCFPGERDDPSPGCMNLTIGSVCSMIPVPESPRASLTLPIGR